MVTPRLLWNGLKDLLFSTYLSRNIDVQHGQTIDKQLQQVYISHIYKELNALTSELSKKEVGNSKILLLYEKFNDFSLIMSGSLKLY